MPKRKMMIGILLLILISGIVFSIRYIYLNYTKDTMDIWLEQSQLDHADNKEQLYEAALLEGTLVIYSVSSRVFEVAELFQQEYPGLTVEIKDVRGDDVVNQLLYNNENEIYECDLVICSDNDGRLFKDLIEPGIIYSYMPQDIKPHMLRQQSNRVDFLGGLLLTSQERL